MKAFSTLLIAAFLFVGFSAFSQTKSQALSKINTESFQKSQVMHLIGDLSHVYGLRLTGSDPILKDEVTDFEAILARNRMSIAYFGFKDDPAVNAT